MFPNTLSDLKKGDRVVFGTPEDERLTWTVRGVEGKYVVLTAHIPFQKSGNNFHTIIDTEEGIRGPVSLIGQGWDTATEENIQDLLDALHGRLEYFPKVRISHRNQLPVVIKSVRQAKR